MTAIALAGFATAQTATNNNVVTKPNGGTVTDTVVAHWVATGVVADANMTLPAGWSQLVYFSPTGGPSVKIAYKALVQGAEPTSYTFSLVGTPVIHGVTLTRWSNVDLTQISDAFVPYTTNSGSSLAPTALDVFPVTDGAVLLAFFASPAGTITPPTTPNAFTTAATINTNIRNVTSYFSQAAAGHSGDLAATLSATGAWTAILWPLRPIDVGTPITVTLGNPQVTPSNLELSMVIVDKEGGLNWKTAYRTKAVASLQGVYYRIAAFLGGFGGRNDPLYLWNGVGTLPALNTVSTASTTGQLVNIFDTGGLQYFLDTTSELNVPLDIVVWRLPWQFTKTLPAGADSTQTDYYGSESRVIRSDSTTQANYQLYIRRLCGWLIANGVRRFKIGSEWKGQQGGGPGGGWNYPAMYTFFALTQDGILQGAADAHVSSSLIEISSPYIVTAFFGGTSNNSLGTTSWTTTTTPPQTVLGRDDAVPPTWDVYRPTWGYPEKPGIKALPEFLKTLIANSRTIDMVGIDFGEAYADAVAYTTDMFAFAEGMTRDMVRWCRRLLRDIGDGRFANLPIDIAEYYVKSVVTFAQTTNVDSINKLPIPGPFIPANLYRPYFAALKACGLIVCVEERVRTPTWWGYNNEGNARSVPYTSGGGLADQQGWYGESVVHMNAISEGETGVNEGDITTVGLMNRMFTQNFSTGTTLRTVTVNDPGVASGSPTRVRSLASTSKCLLVNKTAGRKAVTVGPITYTLAPYDVQVVNLGNSYSVTSTAPAAVVVGTPSSVTLKRTYVVRTSNTPVAVGPQAFTVTGARLLKTSLTAYAVSGPTSAKIPSARILTTGLTPLAVTGQNAFLVHQPPYQVVLNALAINITSSATLRVGRIMRTSPTAFNLTQQATVSYGRILVTGALELDLSGEFIDLLANRVLATAGGNYSAAGQTAILRAGRALVSAQSNFAVTPRSLLLLRNSILLSTAAASYSVLGRQATLPLTRQLTAGLTAVALSTQGIDVVYKRIGHYFLPVDAVSLNVATAAVTLNGIHKLVVDTASFSVSAQDAIIGARRRLIPDAALYSLRAPVVELSYSGEVIPTPPGRVIGPLHLGGRLGLTVRRNRIAGIAK